MTWQTSPYLLPLLITALLSASLVALFHHRRHIPGAVPAAALMTNNSAWALYYMLELASVELSRQVFWAKMQYTAIVAIAPLWLIITLAYTRRDAWLSRRNILLLFAVPVLGLLLVFSNEAHGLVWPETSQVDLGAAMVLQVGHGPGFWMILGYSYLMMILGVLVLGSTFLDAPSLYRRQIAVLLIAASIPWMGNFLYISGRSPWPLLDLTPFAFALTGLLVAWGLFRYGLLKLVPLARDRLLEMMPDGVIVVDMRNHILDLNPAARRLLHQPSGNTRPISRLTSLGSPAAPPVGTILSQALAGWPELAQKMSQPGEMEVDVALESGDSRRYFSANVTLLHSRSEQADGRLIVLREITVRKEAEIEMQRAKEAAEQANRAKSAFLASISHELRTPLTVILGYSEMLSNDPAVRLNKNILRRADRIGTAGQHLMALINNVLDFSKIEAGQVTLTPETFPVAQIVQEVAEITRPQVEANHNNLSVEVDAALGEMHADRTCVRQVLLNLLGNAAKFTENGEITLHARFSSGRKGRGWVVFEVRDTGIGIPGEQLPHIFDAFAQGDRALAHRYGGTGLGLAISQRLCQLMGGAIDVHSLAGGGSTFTACLPLNSSLQGPNPLNNVSI